MKHLQCSVVEIESQRERERVRERDREREKDKEREREEREIGRKRSCEYSRLRKHKTILIEMLIRSLIR